MFDNIFRKISTIIFVYNKTILYICTVFRLLIKPQRDENNKKDLCKRNNPTT